MSGSGLVAGIGATTRAGIADAANGLRFLGACARSTLTLPRTARAATTRTFVAQVRFTASDAMGVAVALALLVGVVIIQQAHAQAVKFGMSRALGQLLATLIVRELGPLFVAILVTARSGTAIATELATTSVSGEVASLEAFGVDPLHFYVLPRVAAVACGVAVLTIYFDAVALAAGLVATWLFAGLAPADYLASLRLGVTSSDLWLVLAKAVLCGAGIALIASRAGLAAGNATTMVPRAVTRAVVLALVYVFVISAAFAVARLAW